MIAKFQKTDLFICNQSREGKTPSYSRISMLLSTYGSETIFLVSQILLHEQSEKGTYIYCDYVAFFSCFFFFFYYYCGKILRFNLNKRVGGKPFRN